MPFVEFAEPFQLLGDEEVVGNKFSRVVLVLALDPGDWSLVIVLIAVLVVVVAFGWMPPFAIASSTASTCLPLHPMVGVSSAPMQTLAKGSHAAFDEALAPTLVLRLS